MIISSYIKKEGKKEIKKKKKKKKKKKITENANVDFSPKDINVLDCSQTILTTKSNRQWDVILIIRVVSNLFELVQYFIHVHLKCKFHEDPIKTECVILVQMSNRGVFSNLENVTLR